MIHPKIKRRDFHKAAGLAGLGVLAGGSQVFASQSKSAAAGGQGKRPNILFINLDQMHPDAFSSKGDPYANTPNSDFLRKGGVSFDNTYSPNPVCGPNRSCWFTGRHSFELGTLFNPSKVAEEVKRDPAFAIMGSWFKNAGYDTFHSGKWHVAGVDVNKHFDKVPIISGDGTQMDPIVVRSFTGYLSNYKSDKPFLAVLGLHNPHDIPLWRSNNNDPEFINGPFPLPEIEDDLPELPPNFHSRPDEPATFKVWYRPNNQTKDFTEKWFQYYRWTYYRYIEMVDKNIGEILKALKASGQLDNTIICYTSDHGEGQGFHRTSGKQYLYDESARVHLNWYGPKFFKGGVVNNTDVTSLLDIFPTMCDFAGIEPPPRARGVSLKKVMESQDQHLDREFVVSESQGTARMIRTKRYKYIEYQQARFFEHESDDGYVIRGDNVQLFDMKNDPLETSNLSKKMPELTKELQKKLRNYEKDILEDLPYLDKSKYPRSPDGQPIDEASWRNMNGLNNGTKKILQ